MGSNNSTSEKAQQGKKEKSACVLVMGDIGHSPRMQNHAYTLATQCKYHVDFVGFAGINIYIYIYIGSELPTHIISDPHIRVIHIPTKIQNCLRKLPRFLYLIYAILRILFEMMFLFYILLFKIRSPQFIILQNPPSIPALYICIWVKWLRRTKLVIDWHNFGFTILRVGRANRIFVKLAYWYEKYLSKFGTFHLCVSGEMKTYLRTEFSRRANILRDRANPKFFRLDVSERHELFKRVFGSRNLDTEEIEETIFTQRQIWRGAGGDSKVILKRTRPALILSSTSFTPDEDFGILLEALKLLPTKFEKHQDKKFFPELKVVITGKGPLKAMYQEEFKRANLPNITVTFEWLSPEDYCRLLGSGDVGISFHTSSSGLDLPMKVVDMLGAELPVLAVEYKSIRELITHNRNGIIFKDANQLAISLITLFKNFGEEEGVLERLRSNAGIFRNYTWDQHWKDVLFPLLIKPKTLESKQKEELKLD